jgi:hypothetical protein
MGRIRDAYESKFRTLLRQVQPRRLELGVQLLLERAERLSERQGINLPAALAQVYERVCDQVARRQTSSGQCAIAVSPEHDAADTPIGQPEFVCDAGLGGLARWLRAVGYEAHWNPDIDDDDLIRAARRIPATLLTTDSLMMERGVLRDGFIPALWVPPSMKKFQQLQLVLRELRLSVRDPRCMSCGGELRAVDKESVRERIPPKTYRWRDEYFVCARCDKLFWHGSHWDRIGERLRKLRAEPDGQATQ